MSPNLENILRDLVVLLCTFIAVYCTNNCIHVTWDIGSYEPPSSSAKLKEFLTASTVTGRPLFMQSGRLK